MSVELTIETVEETIVLELQDHVPAVLTIDNIPELRDELDSKVDKVEGYSLVADDEIAKLATVQENATANRADSENADKVHGHDIGDVTGLSTRLNDIDSLLIITKETFRVSLGMSEDVPFSQYAAYIPWGSDVIPATGAVFDFQKSRYAKDGRAVYLADMPSQFTRLSSATMWKADKIIDVTENTPRINSDGLLIEPQRTNLFPDSVITTGVGVIPTTLEIGEGNTVPAVMLTQEIDGYAYARLTPPSPCVISMYVKNSDNSEPAFSGVVTSVGFDFAFVLASRPVDLPYSVSKISTVYRVSTTSILPEPPGNAGIIKYAKNSPKDVTATWRQLEAGDTLTSYIRSSGSPTTRAKETLVIPFAAGQTVTAEKDEGVTMTIVDNNAVFEGQGYIRSIRVN